MTFFMVCAVMCLLGMIGEKNQQNQRNFTYGFIVCIVAAVITKIL